MIFFEKQYVEYKNFIYIEIENVYNKNGWGISKHVNNNDVIIYTNCEPCFASSIYPCFDQPDIKGIFKVKIMAPISWLVLWNEMEKNIEIKTKKKIVEFNDTKLISTYLFCFTASNYIECINIDENKNIRFFCWRENSKKMKLYVDELKMI